MLHSCYDKNGNIINFYTIFNVSNNAGIDEIKAAFRTLIKRYHPDLKRIPDEHITEKVDLIIRGYRILTDNEQRFEYDRILYNKGNISSEGLTIIPKKRIIYSSSLSNILKAQLLPRGIKRKDIISNFGQDIEVMITPLEARKGAIVFIELPARMICPMCRGGQSYCSLCRGIGRINTTSQLEVRIPPHVDDSTFIDVDLLKLSPDKFTTFCQATLRIKIIVT